MKCPKCGFENLDIANFCIKCGARIDEKIPCPKCGEYISNDAEHCPVCGKAIPHKSKTNLDHNQKVVSKRSKTASVFNRVSCFVSLFLFIFVILSSVFGYLDFFRFKGLQDFDLVMQIIRAVISISHILVTVLFSVYGIFRVAKAFKNRELIVDTYKYLAIDLASIIATSSLLKATYHGGAYLTGVSLLLILLIFFHLSACLGFDCFLHFKRGQVSIFIARIILAVGLVLPILILTAFSSNMGFSNGMVSGFIIHYVDMLYNLINGVKDGAFITVFVLGSISFLLAIIIISLTYSLIVYFVTSYFRGMNRFRKFRIGFYMLVISLSILATIYLVSSLIELSLYTSYLGIGSIDYLAPMEVFVYAVLLMGVAIATFNIYNRANRRAQLEEKTTIKE